MSFFKSWYLVLYTLYPILLGSRFSFLVSCIFFPASYLVLCTWYLVQNSPNPLLFSPTTCPLRLRIGKSPTLPICQLKILTGNWLFQAATWYFILCTKYKIPYFTNLPPANYHWPLPNPLLFQPTNSQLLKSSIPGNSKKSCFELRLVRIQTSFQIPKGKLITCEIGNRQ